MYISGFAFKENWEELQDNNVKRFREIEHIRETLNMRVETCYKHNKFHGHINTDEEKTLSERDFALLADYGNLCFGGSCTISGERFHGSYNTD